MRQNQLLQDLAEACAYLDSHDQLTGLRNRRSLIEGLGSSLLQDNVFSVLFIDLDFFKPHNDGLGHVTGDALLVETAKRLTKAVNGHGWVARHGADEFVICFNGEAEEAYKLGREILEAIREPYKFEQGESRISASIGLLHVSDFYKSSVEVLRDADLAMIKAKKLGKDRLIEFDLKMRNKALRRYRLEKDLLEALEAGDLEVVYQPIVSLEDRTNVAFEALSRWTHPTMGKVSPGEFIPIAEESGLIAKLGEHVLETVARDVVTYPCLVKNAVYVNVSAEQLLDPLFVGKVLAHTENLPAGSIGIEITESAIIRNKRKISSMLDDLRQAGVQAHLDDFGTGYASLTHMINLPLSGVKIDMSLVKQIENPRAAAAIRATLDLARELGLHCIAEGVSQQVQLDLLEEMKCDYIQGFLLAKPMDAKSASSFKCLV